MSPDRYTASAVRTRRVTPGIGLAILAFIFLAGGSCAPGETKAGLGPNDIQPEAIAVIPDATTAVVGEIISVRAQVSTASGPVATAEVNWSASGGTITPVSNSKAQFSAPLPGVYMIRAYSPMSPSVVDSTFVTIIESDSPIVGISISPPVASVPTGGSLLFTVVATRADGTTFVPPVTYSATGGTISSGGLYTAGSTAGTFRVIARQQGGTLADTSTVTLSATPPPQGGSHEPAGYVRFAENNFTSITTGNTGIDGSWVFYPRAGALAVVPIGNGDSALQFKYSTGQAPGAGDGVFEGWDGVGSTAVEYAEFYESMWVRIPTADFETQQVGVKFLGYWGVGDRSTSDPVQVAGIGWGNGTTGPMTQWQMTWVQQGMISRRLDANVNTSYRFRAGQWMHYEVQMVLNDIGSANGILRVWLDGNLTHQYTNVEWRFANAPAGFFGQRWDPIWGGEGGPNKSRDDYLQVSRIYLSGKRL